MNKAEKFRQLTCTQKIRADLRGSSVRAAALTGAAGAIDFIIRIGSTAILARLVLPSHQGLVMMVTAVTAVADQFRDLGLSAATVQRKEISHKEVTNLFWVNVAAGIAIALVVCAISPLVSLYYKDSRLTTITCMLAMNFFWGGLMVQHQALLTRQLKLGHTSAIRLSSSFLSTVLAIVLAWFGFGYWALIWREVARSVLLTAGMWLAFPWIPGLPCRNTDVWGLIRFGSNLAGANILASVSSGVDRLLIGRVWGPGPVAMYRQAYQLAVSPIEQLLSPLYQVTHPGLSMLQTDAQRFRRFYQKVLTMVCVASMPLSLFLAVYSTEVTRIVLGRKWSDSAPILMILCFGAFIKQPVGSAAFVLVTCGRSRTYLVLTLVQNATLILLMMVGVGWGAKGVAMADVAATYLLMGPRLHYCFKGSPVTVGAFFSTIARTAFASVVMSIVLIMLRFGTPAMPSLASLALGGMVAMAVFSGVWMLSPGGIVEFKEVISDLRSALQRKVTRIKTAEPVALAD